MREHHKPILGLAYLVIVALLVAVSIATFRKAMPWQAAAHVTLTTSSPGLELNPLSDVKLQGVRVGEVRRITSTGRAATIELALDKDKLELIPANVDAAIVPKTLFGEKFVDLKVPKDASPARLAAGGVIKQSTTSVELSELFGNLVPMLRALKPEQLSTVLTSMAEALDGRGEQIARTLDQLDGFLEGVDPHLATFTHDLRQLATTADVYAESAPQIKTLLEASATISQDLLVSREKQFAALLDKVTSTSGEVDKTLSENSKSIIELSGTARSVLALLDEYSSELPCFLKALHDGDKFLNHALGSRGPFAHVNVDMVTQRTGYSYPDDLPSNPKSDANNANLPAYVPAWGPHCPQYASYVLSTADTGPGSEAVPSPTRSRTGAQGSSDVPDALVEEARRALARALAARLMEVPQKDVPPYAELLLAPMLGDGKVSVP